MRALRQFWRELKSGEPGRRFRDYHERHAKTKRRLLVRVAKLVGAVVAFAIAIAEVFIPGPAILFFFLGGALLASEFKFAATAMDWLEVRLRSVWLRVRRWWERRRSSHGSDRPASRRPHAAGRQA